jgi:hypothetical protein
LGSELAESLKSLPPTSVEIAGVGGTPNTLVLRLRCGVFGVFGVLFTLHRTPYTKHQE